MNIIEGTFLYPGISFISHLTEKHQVLLPAVDIRIEMIACDRVKNMRIYPRLYSQSSGF